MPDFGRLEVQAFDLPRIGLQLTRFPYEDSLWHLQLIASNSSFSGAQDFYIDKNELLAFGRQLRAFPSSLSHEPNLEIGSKNPDFACFVLLRAYVHDGVGHSALECSIQRNEPRSNHAETRFSITCEPASLNRLGHHIEQWVDNSDEPMEWLVNYQRP